MAETRLIPTVLLLPLQRIATIRSGLQVRGRIDVTPDGTHRIVQTKDIDRYLQLHLQSLDGVDPPVPPQRSLVHEGDVLFLSRGHHPYAVPVLQPLSETVAAGYFYIVRPRTETILPEFIAWWINQPPAQQFLRSVATGTHTQFVAKSEFAQLQIPVPPLDTQRKIVALASLATREQRLLADVAEQRILLVGTFCLRAAEGRHQTGNTGTPTGVSE